MKVKWWCNYLFPLLQNYGLISGEPSYEKDTVYKSSINMLIILLLLGELQKQKMTEGESLFSDLGKSKGLQINSKAIF